MSWTELILAGVLFTLGTITIGILFKFIMKIMGATPNVKNLSESEQLALLEAVVMTIYIDGRREFTELKALESLLKQGEWKFAPEKHLKAIDQKAINALQQEQEMSIYLDDIKNKVESENAGQTIILACNDFGEYGNWRGWWSSPRRRNKTAFLVKLRNKLLAPSK